MLENFDIRNTTPRERIIAVARYFKRHNLHHEYVLGLEHALELIQLDGWKHTAPAWYEIPDSKTRIGVKRPAEIKPPEIKLP